MDEDDESDDESLRRRDTHVTWRSLKIPKAKKTGTGASGKFTIDDLPLEERARWNKACDLYVVDFLYSKTFLGDVERTTMARNLVQKYGLQDQTLQPTTAQLDAVFSWVCYSTHSR